MIQITIARIGITTGWEPGSIVPGFPLIYTVKACIEAVEKAGGIPLLLPILENKQIRREVLHSLDGIIAAGEVLSVKQNVLQGNRPKDLESQNPLRYANERDYLLGALDLNMPILGICRGHQVLNVICGGEMYLDDIHDRPENNGTSHQQAPLFPDEVTHSINMQGILSEITGCSDAWVNSFHRQAIKTPPSGFEVIAQSQDGIIEGISSTNHDFVVSVQFHPEFLTDPAWLKLFQSLVSAGAQYRKKGKDHAPL